MKTRFIGLLLIFAFCALAVNSQTSRGTVTGTVTDSSGALLAGATITLTNPKTGSDRSTTSNGEGLYRFDAVDPGTYSVKISASGFGEVTKTNVEVAASQTAEVGATMTPAGQQVTVDVSTESGVLLQTEAPVRGGNIEGRRITELPVAGRNPVALALTLPGVSSNRFGFGVGTFSVNGSRGRSNNFLIDGTENNDISVAGQAFQITNPDAVQEVSVQTSNYDAEFGRAGGAVVNVITKAGTNDFHGSASYLLDSTFDDALTNTQALNTTSVLARNGHPPVGTEQWFAGTFGGPVLLPHFGEGGSPFGYNGRNRTFFFGAYQEQRQVSNSTFSRVVPTANGLATLRSIFPVGANPRLDTYLGAIAGTVGSASPFLISLSNNPASACASLPAGSRPCVEFGTAFIAASRKYLDRQAQVRIDHKLGENDQLSGRYLFDNQVDPLGGDFTFPGFQTVNQNRYQNVLLSETHIFNPSLTNELRVAFNRIKISFPNEPPNALGQTLLRYDITQLSSIGISTVIPQGRVANNYVVQDTMTYLHGNHTFRFGLDVLKQRSRQFAPIVERGLLTYASGGANWSGFANFLDDFGGSGGGPRRDFGSAKYYPFLTRQAYFLQDRWKFRKSTTLTLGVRYENFGQPLDSLITSVYTGLFNVDPLTLNGPYNQPNKAAHDNNNFAPTVGLAYSPSFEKGLLGSLIGNNKTVLRMGYQIGYDSFFNNIASNAQTSAPNVVAFSISSTVVTGTAPRGLGGISGLIPSAPRRVLPQDNQTLVAKGLVNPYYQKWSIGIQRELPWSLVLDASYVGNKGTKLYLNEDLNPSAPAVANAVLPGVQRSAVPANYPVCAVGAVLTAANATAQFPAGFICPITGRLDNIQGSRLIRTNGGSSIYHAGQLLVSRRFTRGFALTGAYTYSKFIDNASEVFGVAGTNLPQQAAFPSTLGGQAAERSVSFFDRTHRASFTYVYSLPWYKEQKGGLGRLIGGWEISGVTTFESGVPLTVVNGADSDQFGGNLDRPTFNPSGQAGVRAVPSVATATSNPCSVAVGATYYTNPDASGACIDRNAAMYIGNPAGSGIRGNLGRNTLRTNGINNFNLNILKRINITEGTHLEFRTEFYNIFNHPQFGIGSVSPFSPGEAGVSASVLGSTGNSAGLPGRFLHPEFSDGGGRVIRYQLKFSF